MDGQSDVGTTAGRKDPLTREERLGRVSGWLSGTSGNGRRVRQIRDREVRLGTGLWLHTAARADLGLELTGWEKRLLAPLAQVLGEEELHAVGRLYREHREAGTLAVVPRAVAARSFDEPFSPEEIARQVGRLGELAMSEPNVAWVNRNRVLAGEGVDSEEFMEAAAAAGYGLTAFNGAGFTSAEAGQAGGAETAALTPFRARLEWDGFYCHEAVGDQGGSRDEIYWTAGCNTVDYQHTTRTLETGSVTAGRHYSIDGGSDGQAFFDASFAGSLGAMLITCWEADQSSAAWYTALGKALSDAVDTLKPADYITSFVPSPDLMGHMMLALDLVSSFWEEMRNKDDHVLTRGFAFSRDDLKALYYSPERRMKLTFNASSEGMGHFSLWVKYTGAAPPGPPPEGSFKPISIHWSGLMGTTFTSDLDAACAVPGHDADVYLFKGDQFVRYSTSTEEMRYGGIRSIRNSWTGLPAYFTSGLDAGCAVPGSRSDVYLFKGDHFVRYDLDDETLKYGGTRRISDSWSGLRGTSFTSGLDAACAVPGSRSDVYLFKGDHFVRYDLDDNSLKYGGIRRISDSWPRLADTEFAHSIQAACAVPGSRSDVYLFKGSRYVRYTV
ncbi:hemopexin repeat-containing protein [Streptomyces sp. NPDC053367]|uniref:hemopexin repeat-containing protein n=1 Tax=Streptomyces sp. NPDC053367 TaxID=3365700 RepID=UPI0037D6F49D